MLDEAQSLAPPPAPRLPERHQCRWPLWGHREAATHRYCCEPVVLVGAKGLRGCFCGEHALVAMRPILVAAESAGSPAQPRARKGEGMAAHG